MEGEFQFAQSMDGNTIEEIQEALEESIRGGFGSGFVIFMIWISLRETWQWISYFHGFGFPCMPLPLAGCCVGLTVLVVCYLVQP